MTPDSNGWLPMSSWKNDWKPILRYHVIHGAMDVVRRNLGSSREYKWMNGDMTTWWPDDAFTDHWQPLPGAPEGVDLSAWRPNVRKIDNLSELNND